MRVGIVGLTNAGKSTLFSALTRVRVPINNFPFCTIDPNIGMVSVPDSRVEEIASITHPEKKVYATIEFVDVAGLVKGASRGEGLGNQFLAKMREMDILLLTIRAFEEASVIHVEGSVDPLRDLELLLLELALSDYEIAKKRLNYLEKVPMGSDPRLKEEKKYLEALFQGLSGGDFSSLFSFPDQGRKVLSSYGFLMLKPMLVVLNISEDKLSDLSYSRQIVSRYPLLPCLEVPALLEYELLDLKEEERQEYMSEIGLKSSLDELILKAYQMLDLITFFSTRSAEVRAWPVTRGTSALKAASKIHTDMGRGFIKAEVVYWEDLIRAGGWPQAKEMGLLLVEGKDYIVQDGDVIYFKFQV